MGQDTPADIQLENGIVQDRNLGANFKRETQANWKSNGCYFQWGRISFNDWGTSNFKVVNSTANTVTDGIRSVYPQILNAYFDSALHNDGDWLLSAHKNDLWGVKEAGKSKTGVKSVYDPCPKGYKVMSGAIAQEICTAIQNGTATIDKTATPYFISYNGASFNLAGGFNQGTSGANSRGSSNTNRLAWYWTDCAYNEKDATCIYFDLNNYSKYTSGESTIQMNRPRACSYSIRCMKDTDNR